MKKPLFLIFIIYFNVIVFGQEVVFKGQFWSNNLYSDDALKEQSSFETQLGYIPTISYLRYLSDEKLFDIEWAYRINRIYSGDALFSSAERLYRGWVRYSTNKMEARLGLQKIAFGPAQVLRPTSWFDTIDLRDPTGQTDGVEAFRLRIFPSNSLSLWSWVINSNSDTLSYGGRLEVTTLGGDWGLTLHQDPVASRKQVGLLPIVMSEPNTRAAIDYRYDGFVGLWFEGASLFSSVDYHSNYDRYNLLTLGGDFTFPIGNGILVMTESMQIYGTTRTDYDIASEETIEQTYTVFMASMPVGLLHRFMAVAQLDWEGKQTYYYWHWGITYDRFSLNFSLSSNPKRIDYALEDEYLPTSLAGFGNGLQFAFIYNH